MMLQDALLVLWLATMAALLSAPDDLPTRLYNLLIERIQPHV